MRYEWPEIDRRYPESALAQIETQLREFQAAREAGNLLGALAGEAAARSVAQLEALASLAGDEARLWAAREAGRLDVLRLLAREGLGVVEAFDLLRGD